MIPGLLRNKDFWAGMMLVGIGAAAMFIARDYRFGSALRMGPGFFPTILSGILIAFGVCIMAVGLRSGEKIKENLSIRPLVLLPLSLLLFGILMELAGFVPALVVLIFVSAASGKEFRFMEVLLLTVTLVVASVALFIWGLGLPYPLLRGF
ncbi:MAG: tripartite tricarboxylate transporter TctB family protein [Proteobacteria bacterium]|nr:tripartite tricarboxylate transporter TctB family protein [Pseudomonadota bacterium]MBU2228145.1 tripartite tricarboxylate transporter TctB family protein [Pseudomonadota bacterium]MBU2262466.1 tripartite tricarboxylate transporter TctB family protein [Pseudomonadota bacterium]